MAEELVARFGYVGLFCVSFLAATLLPISSEVLVLVMVALGYSVPPVVAVATLGNSLGAVVNYYVGREGAGLLLARYLDVKPERLERARRMYGRWGSPVLFFSWVPVIGDPLTVVAGALRVNLLGCAGWVVAGKLLRYVAVALMAN